MTGVKANLPTNWDGGYYVGGRLIAGVAISAASSIGFAKSRQASGCFETSSCY